MKGIVHKVKPTYGFILVEDVKQVFFHISQWLSKDAPKVFDEVEFELVPSPKPQFNECANRVRKAFCDAAVDALAQKDGEVKS